MSDKLIDYKELEQLYNKHADSKAKSCEHIDAISVDQHGVYHINCKQCGVFGATSEAGARALGWIE